MFIFGMGFLIADRPVSQFLRAQNQTVSPSKSFFTAIPQASSTEGSEKAETKEIKVDVFIRDENGNVIPNKTVKISTDLPQITYSPADTQTTDDLGKASFILKSPSPGTANITVSETTSGTTLSQKLSIQFTNP